MAKELEFDGIDLVLNVRHALTSEEKINALIKKYGLPIANVHQPRWQWPYTSRGALERLCARARGIGARSLTVHFSVLRFHQQKEIFPYLKKLEKQYSVIICCENGKQGTLETPPDWGWQQEKITTLAQTYDLHLTLDVPGLLTSGGNPTTFFKENQNRIGVVHIHGVRASHFHYPLFLSDIDVIAFFEKLQEEKYPGTVVLEVFPLQSRLSAGVPRESLYREVHDILKKDIEALRRIRGDHIHAGT